ncbi:MAG: type I-F CRISPR-associated endoribonuclease Cas6/Csy4 [Verrucomicrobiales bacterium]|nr:type I-F CRISPR-associated endoribonuclease Cas6/Csy4 [Verrucomicrobiales bacterium]
MNFFQEVRFLPDSDIGTGFLWGKFYCQLHLSLVEFRKHSSPSGLGVSFPDYQYDPDDPTINSLGSKLRVFSESTENLSHLDLRTWLKRFSDYLVLSEVQSCKSDSKNVRFNRVQQNQSPAKLRRFIRRFQPSEEQISAYEEKLHNANLDFPYIELQSLSAGHQFRLYIRKEETSQSVAGTFSTYGLSKEGATVPDF